MIRSGIPEDIPRIDAFDPFGGSREQEICEGRLHVFEQEGGVAIAYISIAEYRLHGFPYVTFLLVHPDHQRRGIATKLLRHVEAMHEGQRLFVSTESDNPPMLALLEKESYERSGALSGLNDSHSGAEEVFFYKDL
jgi:ribosomal protein S18 acetylase RimI-like enzyme